MKKIVCKDCSKQFDFNGKVQKGHSEPIRCRVCRDAKRQRNAEGNKRGNTQISRDKSHPSKIMKTEVEHANVVILNQEISQHAKRKELAEAKHLYIKAKSLQWVNSHTYAAILNAHVRCGDMKGATEIFSELQSDPTMPLDIVSCTTMLKGYGSSGDIGNCVKIIRIMEDSKPMLIPNIRTCNTFLRCCVLVGDKDQAENMITKMTKQYKITPDISSWEYLITLLCQALQIHKALPIVGRLKDKHKDDLNSIASGLAAIHTCIAKAAVVVGDLKICRKSIIHAEEALKLDELYVDDNSSIYNMSGSGSDAKGKQLTGGKRSWKEIDATREDSLQIFREHRRSELRLQLDEISTFLSLKDKCVSGSSSSSSSSSNDSNGNDNILECFKKTILFNLLNTQDYSSSISSGGGIRKPSMGKILFDLNSSCLGLEEYIKKSSEGNVRYKRVRDCDNNDIDAKNSMLIEHYGTLFDSNGILNLQQLFHTPQQSTSLPDQVKLEVCSGNGDWIVSQSLVDVDSKWISLELRNDRVCSTFNKAILNSINNLCILGGDALKILPRHMPPNSLTTVYVNHPEPPQQTGSDNFDTQASHLLQQEFFMEVQRVLKPQGTLTILTDNLWYGKLLIRLIPTFPDTFTKSMRNMNLKSQSVHEENEGYKLYVGQPNAECGHIADTSSYFDRLKSKELKKRDKLTDRFIIQLRKGDKFKK